MKSIFSRIILTTGGIGLLLLSAGCGQEDFLPTLVGKWIANRAESDDCRAMGELEFAEKTLILGGVAQTVQYDTDKGRVIATPERGDALTVAVKDGHLFMDAPKKCDFVRPDALKKEALSPLVGTWISPPPQFEAANSRYYTLGIEMTADGAATLSELALKARSTGNNTDFEVLPAQFSIQYKLKSIDAEGVTLEYSAVLKADKPTSAKDTAADRFSNSTIKIQPEENGSISMAFVTSNHFLTGNKKLFIKH